MLAGTAIFKLDDGDNPGQALVKVLRKLTTQQAQAIKALTGHDTYRVEVVEVTKASTFAANPNPGKKMDVSAKHLISSNRAPLPAPGPSLRFGVT